MDYDLQKAMVQMWTPLLTPSVKLMNCIRPAVLQVSNVAVWWFSVLTCGGRRMYNLCFVTYHAEGGLHSSCGKAS